MDLDVFHLFPRLSPEIRRQIWDEFMYEESDRRFVLINWQRQRVVPNPCLISPLLKVSWESRERALALYSLKLQVMRRPAIQMRKDHPSTFLRAYEKHELMSVGVIYLDPKRDIFVKLPRLPNPLEPYKLNLSDDLYMGIDLTLHRYTTEPMNLEKRALVRRCLNPVVTGDRLHSTSCLSCHSLNLSLCYFCRQEFRYSIANVVLSWLDLFPQAQQKLNHTNCGEQLKENFIKHAAGMTFGLFFQAFAERNLILSYDDDDSEDDA